MNTTITSDRETKRRGRNTRASVAPTPLRPSATPSLRLSPHAFTLVELMVVITIIVILLALLTPALDRAVYQAELTVCGARLDAIGSGLLAYAMDRQRRYPYRPTLDRARTQPHAIRIPASQVYSRNTGTDNDDRPYLRDFVNVRKQLLDPFVRQNVDLDEPPQTPTDIDLVWSSYALWYGTQYTTHRGMKKLGDRFTWNGHAFSVLASDLDWLRIDKPYERVSHPDYTGDLYAESGQRVVISFVSYTYSWWATPKASHGPIDMNFAIDDGSVQRVNAVRFDDGSPANADEGPITGVPDDMVGTTNGGTWWYNLLSAGRG